LGTKGKAFWIATAGSAGVSLCVLAFALQAPTVAVAAAFLLGAVVGALVLWTLGRPLAAVETLLEQERASLKLGTSADTNALASNLSGVLAHHHAAHERLEQSLITKDEAVSGMVHELRTPLTTITASLDMIHEGFAAEPEELSAFLEQASIAARHMSFLINDVLDSAAVDAGRLRMDIADWNLSEVLMQITKIMHPLAAVRSIDLITCPPPSEVIVRGDHGRILQVVFNLVSNAIKYSPEGSRIELQTAATPLGAVIEVVDEGIGVPIDARKKLFSKYHRPHSAESSDAVGTGIGLYLAKILVERMGGAIGYENRDDAQGSIFWVTLPLAHEPSQRVAHTG